MSRIAVIGAGAWGTALAIVLGRNGRHSVSLWAFERDVCDSIVATRRNQMFLPGATIPDSVMVSTDLQTALAGTEIVVSVMPSHHCRRVFTTMSPHLNDGMTFVSA